MISQETLLKQAEEVKDSVILHRRKIHRYAEIGGKEYKTHKYICEFIEKLGLPYENVTETAILATLDTGKPGPHIALRADIDALPLKENPDNLCGPRTCISEQEGTCHACGHDAHAAMLMGCMEVLCNLKDSLSGVIYFCFEAGEENGASHLQMLDALGRRSVDTVWAIHVYAALESGKIGIRTGACMAGFGGIDITVHGKSGHGSRPDRAINPVYVAAEIVSNIPGVFVNQLDVEKTVTFGVTSIQGGQAFNVFPETAHIWGSMRFFDLEEGEKALQIVKKVADHTAAIYGCQIEYGKMMGDAGIPVVNNKELAELAKASIREIYSQEDAVPDEFPLFYASESYSRYCHRYPGIMALLGIKNPEYGSGAEHHNEKFDVDENVLDMGVKSTVKYVTTLMENGLPV